MNKANNQNYEKDKIINKKEKNNEIDNEKENNEKNSIKKEDKNINDEENYKKNQIKIIKHGKNIDEKTKKENQKEANKKTLIMYLIPLIILIVLGISYIFTQLNILLIPFAILMFIVLIGWDGSTRTCPNCKKWNSIIWIKNENFSKTEKITKNKKVKKTKKKYTINQGKCKNCDLIYETKKQRII